jgi:hypothetical protein
MTRDLSNWVPAGFIVQMVKEDLGIDTPTDELIDSEIKTIMHHIGVYATELYCIDDGTTRISSFGVGIMLTVCLLVFPDYYERYGLSQFN